MKKFITFGLIATAAAYYASLPFVVAQADIIPFQGIYSDSATTGTSAGTTIAQAPTGNDTTDTPISVLSMRVTAYASVPDETDNTPFIMADGDHVYDGAAASNILPFGTKIEIPDLFGDKVFTIEDRMSTRIKNTIDIWMPSVHQAIVFGANHADIVVLSVPTSTPLALK